MQYRSRGFLGFSFSVFSSDWLNYNGGGTLSGRANVLFSLSMMVVLGVLTLIRRHVVEVKDERHDEKLERREERREHAALRATASTHVRTASDAQFLAAKPSISAAAAPSTRVFLHIADTHADPFYDYTQYWLADPKISRDPALFSKKAP